MEAEIFQRASEIQEANEKLRAANSALDQREKELTQLTERLQSLDRMKSQFFANVSHELRTPLTLILGPVEKMLSDPELTADERRDLQVVERNAHSLLKHVNDLLDLAKLEAGKMAMHYRRLDLAQLVRRVASCFELHARASGCRFEIEAPDALLAEVDPDQIERALANLLGNAFKFTPAGGAVRCALALDPGGAREARIEVADSGPGVAPAHRKAIFERFFQAENSDTRRYGGTGLGLAIAKDFVEMHGGTIRAGVAAEGGASFVFTVPLEAAAGTIGAESAVAFERPPSTLEQVRSLADDRALAAAGSDASGIGADGRPLVLVVEDNTDMRRHIRSLLEQRYRTEGASDGQEGLEKAGRLLPDLIISDVMMPKLSGTDLLAAVRARPELAEVPLIALTAKADDAVRVALLRGGAQDYLVKPFSAEELLTRVHNLVAQSRRHYERTLALNQRLEAANRDLEHFIHISAHDMREPLRRQRNLFDLLRQDLSAEAADATRPLLDALQRSSAEALAMFDAFRELDGVGGHRLARADVALVELIEGCLAGFATEVARRRVAVHWDEFPATVRVYDSLIGLLYRHLIANAFQNVASESFDLHFTCESGAAGPIFGVLNSNSTIPPAQLPELFKMFRGRNPAHGGRGIGLSICQRIVERHRGRIHAESGDGHVHVKFTFGDGT